LLRSPLFLKLIIAIFGFIALSTIGLYYITVPEIRRDLLADQEHAAKTALDNVYKLAQNSYLNIESYKQNSLNNHKANLKQVTSLAVSFLESLHQDYKAGRISLSEAKRQAIKRFRSFRFGKNDYIWISDYRSRLISHPDPKLHQSDFSNVKDIQGELIMPPLVKQVKTKGEAFHKYYWRRLEQKDPEEKLAYAVHYPKWKWVIATGVYIGDIEEEVKKRRLSVVKDMKSVFRDLIIAKTGYMYIFDANKMMLIHPAKYLEGKTIHTLLNPATGEYIADELIATAFQANNKLEYIWDTPQDPENYVYQKIAWVKYFRGFDWFIAASVYTDELLEPANLLRNRIFLYSSVSVLFLIIYGIFWLKTTVHPINELADLARRIESGDLKAKSGIQRKDEIGYLAKAFNRMLERLRTNIHDLDRKVAQRTSELNKKNRELELSVETLKTTQSELIESEKQTKAASEAKSYFLANISHELRTPLNSIIGYTEMLLETAYEEDLTDIANDLERIRSAAKHHLNLINDVLDISRIEAGKMTISNAKIDIKSLAESVLGIYKPLALKKNIRLVFELDPDIREMYSDVTRVRQILLNLLSNAFKFTELGHVTFSAKPTRYKGQAGIEFTISDSGCGIAPDKLELIFEPFEHADTKKAIALGGTGLGLAISKRLTNRLGGKITVESELGQGTTFTVVLPENIDNIEV
jgi:signal transduction histidine kinase